MTTEAQVREAVEAGEPGRALLILARAIDEQRAQPAKDPWALPDVEDAQLHAHVQILQEDAALEREWDESAGRAAYNERLEELGPEPTDPEAAQAWHAARQLALDLLKPPTPDVGFLPTDIVSTNMGADRFEVTLPAVDRVVQDQRRQFAATIGIDTDDWPTRPELSIDPKDAVEAYVKGGPLWLHAYDRDFVMQLPEETRRTMVRDVELTTPNDAHDLGRDILKDTDPHSNKAVALQHQAAAMGLPRSAVDDV